MFNIFQYSIASLENIVSLCMCTSYMFELYDLQGLGLPVCDMESLITLFCKRYSIWI